MSYIRNVCVLLLMSLCVSVLFLSANGAGEDPRRPPAFTLDPSSNSKLFAEYVRRQGANVSTIDFSSEQIGPLSPDAFLDLGVTLRGTSGLDHITSSRGPGQGGATPPRSTGEGLHSATAYVGDSLGSGILATLTVSFAKPVIAAGLDTIDLDSSTASENAKIDVYSGPNGSGELLGSAFAKNVNFQQNGLYFMGLGSNRANIRSLVFTSFGKANDRVGIADIRYARPPRSSALMWVTGAGVMAVLTACGLLLRKRTLKRELIRKAEVHLPASSRAASETYRSAYFEDERRARSRRSTF